MFLQLPYYFSHHLVQTVLTVNTVVLIIALISVELVYSEQPKSKRKHLVYFLPIMLVLIGLLTYAAYRQARGA